MTDENELSKDIADKIIIRQRAEAIATELQHLMIDPMEEWKRPAMLFAVMITGCDDSTPEREIKTLHDHLLREGIYESLVVEIASIARDRIAVAKTRFLKGNHP